uniref:Uncharacterized protein n=1 Tax=Arundo donax TaxID=35708 RepID=A0A0A9GU92_ARUDO
MGLSFLGTRVIKELLMLCRFILP